MLLAERRAAGGARLMKWRGARAIGGRRIRLIRSRGGVRGCPPRLVTSPAAVRDVTARCQPRGRAGVSVGSGRGGGGQPRDVTRHSAGRDELSGAHDVILHVATVA